MRRILLIVVLALVLPATPALAQTGGGSPFTPPQVVVPTPTAPVVTVDPDEDNQNRNVNTNSEPSRGLLYGVAGIVALLLAGIGFYITRDARRNLSDQDKREIAREGQGPTRMSPEERKQQTRQKSKSRQKGKAQRNARKANRPR